MPQGPQNGPKVTRSVEFEFERDLRELEVGLVLKLEFELELEHKLELELLRDARSTRSPTPSLAELPLCCFSGYENSVYGSSIRRINRAEVYESSYWALSAAS